MKLEIKNFVVRLWENSVSAEMNLDLAAPAWIHFITENCWHAERLLGTLASFNYPVAGQVLWQQKSIYDYSVEYRKNIRFFSSGSDLFGWYTVRQSLDMYARFFDLSGTADIDIYGDLPPDKPVYALTLEEEIRLKLATFLPGNRELLFFCNPFDCEDQGERQRIAECFSRICDNKILLLTAGVNSSPKPDSVYDIVVKKQGEPNR